MLVLLINRFKKIIYNLSLLTRNKLNSSMDVTIILYHGYGLRTFAACSYICFVLFVLF